MHLIRNRSMAHKNTTLAREDMKLTNADFMASNNKHVNIS